MTTITSNKKLILGFSGFVGNFYYNNTSLPQGTFLTPTHRELDVTNQDLMRKFFNQNNFDTVVNFVAYTNQAGAEDLKEEKDNLVWTLNVQAVEVLAKLCKERDIFFIHLSTDAVFPVDDSFRGPYSEESIPSNDSPQQLGYYGYTKNLGEQRLRESNSRWAIVRISYPFGHLKSPRDFIVKTLTWIKSDIGLFTDQYFTPTYLPDFVRTLDKLCQIKRPGIYHVSATFKSRPPTQYEFGLHLAKVLNLPEVVLSKQLSNYYNDHNNPPRLRYGGLVCTHTQNKLDMKFSTWEDALEKAVIP